MSINTDPFSESMQPQQRTLSTWQKVGIGVLGIAAGVGMVAAIVFSNWQFIIWACNNGYSNKFLLSAAVVTITVGELLAFLYILKIINMAFFSKPSSTN